jgi:Holliday junction resolvase RusA-like endonuclease
MYEFVIPGNPVPWKAHGGYGKKSWNPRFEEKLFFQLEIKKQYENNLPLTIAVKFDYTFLFPIPESFSNKKKKSILEGRVQHIKRPDLTNCMKFTEDCFKEIVIKDDSQVIESAARKMYDMLPRTIVVISLA